jgi:hypothetical protein
MNGNYNVTYFNQTKLGCSYSNFSSNHDMDGAFLMSFEHFTKNFPMLQISRKINETSNVTSTAHANSTSDNAQHTFNLTASANGTYVLSMDTWYHRFYSNGSISGLSLINITVNDAKNNLTGKAFYLDQWGSHSIDLKLVENMTYTVNVMIIWHKAMNSTNTTVSKDFSLVA